MNPPAGQDKLADALDAVLQLLCPHAAPAFRAAALQPDASLEDLAILSAGAPRRLGRLPLPWPSGHETPPAAWRGLSPGQLGRIFLALALPRPDFLREILLRGDDHEKAAILSALPWRADASDYLMDVVNTCRGNSTIIYAAIACHNPYPARFFSDAQFLQLTLKVIFLALPFSSICGLEDRAASLEQPLLLFWRERQAAHRPLPDDVLSFMRSRGLLP